MVKALLARRKDGNGPSSCMAAFWMLQGLFRVGWATAEAADLALEVMVAEGQFSWMNMLAQGATCTTESWPSGTTPGSGLPPGRTWSHPWCAGPNSAIIRLLLGVEPIALGWERFQLAPQPSSLTQINASVPFVRGAASHQVSISITQTPSTLTVTFTVPVGTAAHVCLPPPHAVQGSTEEDATQMTLDGKSEESVAYGRMSCFAADVASGSHTAVRGLVGLPA